MRFWTFAPLFAAACAAVGAGGAVAEPATRVSGPHVHDNLAVYFVHGASVPGPVPLTLQEGVAGGNVIVTETGNVNELVIENKGDAEVFIQAGDIVKGGRQDRVLTVSLLLPPKSGKLPIASFCVEQGRWSGRGVEDASKFNSANEAMPSRAALLAMVAPPAPKPEPRGEPRVTGAIQRQPDETGLKQRKVWDQVARTQSNLAAGLGARVEAPQSATSLQLTLEHEKLKQARADYIKALQASGEKESDIIGYAVAINGAMSSANIYPSNGLFRKMWGKQLAANVTEAIGEKTKRAPDAKPAPAPAALAAGDFLTSAEKGKGEERATIAGMRQETRDADKGLFNETKRADGRWIYKNYLAK